MNDAEKLITQEVVNYINKHFDEIDDYALQKCYLPNKKIALIKDITKRFYDIIWFNEEVHVFLKIIKDNRADDYDKHFICKIQDKYIKVTTIIDPLFSEDYAAAFVERKSRMVEEIYFE